VIKARIHNAIKEALISIGAPDTNFVVERPAEMSHGDYATNAALVAAKALGQSPRDIAVQLEKHFQTIEGIEKTEVAGAGFVNFFVTQEAIAKEVENAATTDSWGSTDLHAGKVVMVEYTDPNPFKEFHIGHLMTNAIGESIARLFEHSGATVKRANYQGDVGLHVAKAIWGKMQKPLTWGEAYVYGSAEYDNHKDEIDAINKKVYEKSPDIWEMYEDGRRESLEHFEEIYKTLGTKFDNYFFESESWPVGLDLVKQNIGEVFEESEGAVVYKGEKDGLHTRVFVNKAGLPTYEAKDIGLLALKEESGAYDISVTVTANEQKEYFKVVLAAAKQISEVKDIAEKTKHIMHSMMRFQEGKMSSRLGNVVTGESLLNELIDASREKMGERELNDAEEVAKQVAVGAIKYTILRQASSKDIIFDRDKALSLEGDSGPYLQYAHTRALSLIKGAQKEGIEPAIEIVEPSNLERVLMHYPEELHRAASELEPHYVTTYLTELASAFNSWYASTRVIGGEHPEYYLLLAQAVEKTLAKGLNVLGIPAPEEM
jgi:arginyl-tRNA synthetase